MAHRSNQPDSTLSYTPFQVIVIADGQCNRVWFTYGECCDHTETMCPTCMHQWARDYALSLPTDVADALVQS
jgi:hypothetical protein